MIDDEAPRVAAGRGDADTGPAHGPGPVAGETEAQRAEEEKWARHGRAYASGWDYFAQVMAREGLRHA